MIIDFEEETEVQKWLRAAREKYGEEVTSHVVPSNRFQQGYEYISAIVATKNGIEVSRVNYPLPHKKWEFYDKTN